jgi:hypothetical protein
MTSAKLDIEASEVDGHLAELKSKFGAGDPRALLSAIASCGNQEITMPEWVVAGFFRAMNRWWGLQCKTLDEAFGVQWLKGAQLGAARKRRALEVAVWNEVTKQHNRGKPINRALFVEIGEAHGIKKTLVQELLRSKENPASGASLSRGLAAHLISGAVRSVQCSYCSGPQRAEVIELLGDPAAFIETV